MKKKFLKIAEIGMTHDGSFGLAKQLTKAAVKSGANVVKYQCHIPEFETTRNAPSPYYFKDENRFEYFDKAQAIKVMPENLCKWYLAPEFYPADQALSRVARNSSVWPG